MQIDSENYILPAIITEPFNLNEIKETLYIIIDEIITNVELQFAQYIDPNSSITERRRLIAILQFKANIIDINKLNQQIPISLISILTKPLEDFIENKELATFHNLNFLKFYIKEIFCLNDPENDLPSLFKRKLIYLNLNSLAFFYWATSEIKIKVNEYDNVIDKTEKLSWYLKELNQIPVNQNIQFSLDLHPIKELISEWLVEEICFLDKTRKLQSKNTLELQSTTDDFKMSTPLSVPQLGFLLRTFIETGLISNKKQDIAIAKLFASKTKTKGREEISAKSLRQHFYKEDENARKAVKQTIINILNYIQRFNVFLFF